MKSLILNGSTTGFQPAKPVLISENLWESLSISEHLGRRFRFQSFLLFCLVFVFVFFGFGLQLLRPATRSARVTPRLIGHKIKSARNSNKPNSKNTKIRKRKNPRNEKGRKKKKWPPNGQTTKETATSPAHNGVLSRISSLFFSCLTNYGEYVTVLLSVYWVFIAQLGHL